LGVVVGRDGQRGPGDAGVDRARGVLVVAAGVVEPPGVAGVGAGVGVCRAAQGQAAAQVDAADPGGRAGRRVRLAVVGDGVRRDHDHRIGLGVGVGGAVAAACVVGVAGVGGRHGVRAGIDLVAGVG